MGDSGFVRFTGCLDPRAREFRPITQITLFQPQFYYPYPPPIPELQLTPFSDFTSTGAPYPNYNTPPAHVSPPSHRATPPLPSSLPPPSAAPTRTLLLSSVPTDVSESEVRRDLEIFGDVRAVQMERLRDGILTVHFYDVRNAQAAAAEIRRQHMQQQSRLRIHYEAVLALNSGSDFSNSNPVAPMPAPAPGLVGGQAVWAQFKLPATAGVPDGINQGTIVIFNLDSEVSTARLKEIFEAFGAVKELRETPLKRHQRFVEFYDVRDAARALSQMNGKEINDKPIVIEFSRPGGHIKRLPKSTQTITVKSFSSPPSYSGRNPRCLPFPPPSPPRISGGSAPNLPPRCYNSQSQLNSKKSIGSKGNGKGDINQGEECSSSSNINSRGGKKNSKKGQTNAIGGGGNQQQQQLESRKSSSKAFSKGRQGKNYLDPRFLINEERVSELDCRDSRTTVMIKNIPNKYSQKLLLNMLDNHCIHCNEQIADGGPLSSYDFVYLPIDFINKCNVGYGFVNMTSPQATLRLYKAFHQHNWEVFNSKKICEVTYARLQGVEALMEHFKNSKFPGEADDYLPVIFSPPRDGRQLTDPTPIVGRSNGVNLQSPTAVSSNSSEEPNDDVRVEEEEEEVNGNNECGGDNDVGGGRSGL